MRCVWSAGGECSTARTGERQSRKSAGDGATNVDFICPLFPRAVLCCPPLVRGRVSGPAEWRAGHYGPTPQKFQCRQVDRRPRCGRSSFTGGITTVPRSGRDWFWQTKKGEPGARVTSPGLWRPARRLRWQSEFCPDDHPDDDPDDHSDSGHRCAQSLPSRRHQLRP